MKKVGLDLKCCVKNTTRTGFQPAA